MRTLMTGLILAGSLSMGACAYDPYTGTERTVRDAAVGAAAGAAVGAGVGAVVGGISPGEGAAIGAVGGAVVGAATSNDNRRWYRDEYGRCYYVDRNGYRRYDPNVRC